MQVIDERLGGFHVLSGIGFGCLHAGIEPIEPFSGDFLKIHLQVKFMGGSFYDIVVVDLVEAGVGGLVVKPDEELTETEVFADVLFYVSLVIARSKRG